MRTRPWTVHERSIALSIVRQLDAELMALGPTITSTAGMRRSGKQMQDAVVTAYTALMAIRTRFRSEFLAGDDIDVPDVPGLNVWDTPRPIKPLQVLLKEVQANLPAPKRGQKKTKS